MKYICEFIRIQRQKMFAWWNMKYILAIDAIWNEMLCTNYDSKLPNHSRLHIINSKH